MVGVLISSIYGAYDSVALVEIPAMGRRKYSYRGKQHGRNELIKEYLWIAYLQSLPPGARPDPNMMRTRKQVSSHIQVLKGFLQDHPACWYSALLCNAFLTYVSSSSVSS